MTSDEHWLRVQREELQAYLGGEGVVHGGIAPEPDWYEPDVLAIWSVQSGATPERRGWWAVTGDVPTDFLSASDAADARTALAQIAARWQAAAVRMAEGCEPDGFSIGTPEDWPVLAPMLKSRADTLAEWAADPELWA